MHEPAGPGRAALPSPAFPPVPGFPPVAPAAGSGSSRPAGTPATVSRSRSPKLVIVTTPTVAPPGTTRDAVPMPPL